MEAKLQTFGSSLLVPCVRELAKESPTIVPSRYIQRDQDPPITSYATSIPDVPIIDMEKLLSGDHMELKKLDSASKEWGFFQLINHGVSSALLEKVKLEISEFFNLPIEEKKKFWQDLGDIEGFGQSNVLSEEQKLDWGDMFFLTTLPTHSRKPRLFPKLPLPFRDTLDNYANELKHLAVKILDFMSKALKMKAEEMRDLFEEGRQSMRMNYYPPCPQPEKVNGLTPHSDGAGLTILLQINEMEGLQIKKDGMWVPVKPIPQTFVVNIGDSLEIVTNGAYRSIEHRAVVNSRKERLSIATFYSPRVDGEMGPAPSLITPQTPALFRRLGVSEYFKSFLAQKLDGKSHLDAMRIEKEPEQLKHP
ncbi:protein SRG1-like [Rhododendron vialii]|uniref:protein SRG1-like n=1 Tax=Rhododendron vialii TaxID=182163 RepID=UPI00265EA530|nr:protein SRG1-like [Rhododendron vialii]